MRQLVVRAINRYQANGGGMRYFRVACNFEPTCSEFTRQAILDRGVLQGIRLGMQRLRRCNQPHLVHTIADPYSPAADASKHGQNNHV